MTTPAPTRTVRVVLPLHLRRLAGVADVAEVGGSSLPLEVEGAVTQRTILDALERAYPVLVGLVRDRQTRRRRPLVRFFACEEDRSNDDPDTPLPEAVASGAEPYLIVGSMAGG